MADVNAIVLCSGRSGSHYLLHCLSNHPDIYAVRGELFAQRNVYRRFLRRDEYIMRFVWQIRDYEASVFKCNYGHAYEHQAWQEIMREKPRVIHLVRENYLRRATSVLLVRKTGQYHTEGKRELVTLEITPKRAVKKCRTSQKHVRKMKEKLAGTGLDVLYLTYAEIVGGEGNTATHIPEPAGEKICEYLDVPYHWMKAPLRRTAPWKLADIYANWPEIRHRVARSRFAYCLEDE